MQMKDNKAPEGGTIRQKVGFATRKSRERLNTAVTNTRRKAGRGIETVGRKLANEDYIHEAEKDSSKEVENKTVDVMKGKNKIEVNPKIQAEETMSPAQKRKDTNLKKKYDLLTDDQISLRISRLRNKCSSYHRAKQISNRYKILHECQFV